MMQRNMTGVLLLALGLTACASTELPSATVLSVCKEPTAEMLAMPEKPDVPTAGYLHPTSLPTPQTTEPGAKPLKPSSEH